MAAGEEKKMISLSADELQAMITEGINKALAAGAAPGSNTRILRKVLDRKVEIRFIDNKAVLGYANRGSEMRPLYIYTKPDPKDPRQEIQMVDLITEGAKEVIPVVWSEFRKESARALCRITKTEVKEWELNQGTVKKKEVEEYSSVELDFDVPLDVMGQARLYTVEVPSEYGGKRQITVHENYVNIA